MQQAAPPTPGRFITFEGIEGSGKSTQLALLADHLQSVGRGVVRTKEPGSTRIGARIREILLHADHAHMHPVCETLLYLADRAQHVHERVRPALVAGRWVLCDRYQDSTAAYQGAARGLPPAELQRLFQLATEGLLPHLTILLDLDVDAGLTRARARNQERGLCREEGRFEAEERAFHIAVREHFLTMARREPERFLVLDADRPPEAIHTDIRRHLETLWSHDLV